MNSIIEFQTDLTHFSPMIHFYIPCWKRQKPLGYLRKNKWWLKWVHRFTIFANQARNQKADYNKLGVYCHVYGSVLEEENITKELDKDGNVYKSSIKTCLTHVWVEIRRSTKMLFHFYLRQGSRSNLQNYINF